MTDPFANLEPPTDPLPPEAKMEVAAPPPAKRRRTAGPSQASLARRLGAAPAAAAAEDPVLRDDPNYRLLCAYGRSALIGPKLKKAHINCDPKALRRLPRQKLPLLLDEVEEVLEGEMSGELADAVLKQGLVCLENLVANRSRYQISGTTEACFANDRWCFLLERAKLRAGIGLQRLDPMTELALLTAQTAAITHAKNTMFAAQPSQTTNLDAPAPAPEEEKKKSTN